jgi:hypothetical protein
VILAHALNQSGPHVEVLIVAGGFLLLGVVFFIQKSVKPVVSVTLVVLAAAMATGAFVVGSNPAARGRRVVVRDPRPGETVPAGKRIPLDVALVGARLASSATAKDGGHLHVLVDGAVTSMPTAIQTPRVGPLEPGEHELTVEFVSYNHFSFSPRVTDTIEIRAK